MGQKKRRHEHTAEREREKRKKRNDMTVTNGDGAMNGVHEKPCTGVKVSKEVEDLLLWEDPIKSGGILGGATFVWSIIAQLLGKPEFPIPEPKPEAIEKFFDCAATQAKTYTNKFVGVFYRIAKGHEPALSLKAAFILYISAKLTGMFTLLTLAYVACVGAFAGPKVYVLYKEDIDEYIGIAKVKVDEVVGQAKEFVNDKVLSKIKPPAKKTE